MIILTNFAQAKKYPGQKYSIALFSPRSIAGSGYREFPLFFPTKDILMSIRAGEITREEYTVKFKALLLEREAKIMKLVPFLSGDPVMCCYCDIVVKGFCHRMLVSDFLVERGVEVHLC